MSKIDQFNRLKQEMIEDKSLPLRQGATNLVLGEGDLDAKVMCLGEGPGYWEDLKGRPFVGAAGKFLDQLLLSIKLPRKDVFISNVVCYRPPENRDPEPEEIAAFQPYIDKLIALVKPKVIVTLGRFSMGKFIPGAKISSIHGKPQIVDWKGRRITIIPMYHPAAGLRRREIKSQIFEDFKRLPEVLKNSEAKEEKNVEQMQLV
ncbi:uracil-DNA glycosylase [Patescibacteria group bacterium]|nr:uracil-DNA glycosylase [Patescibacteria group bacterium]